MCARDLHTRAAPPTETFWGSGDKENRQIFSFPLPISQASLRSRLDSVVVPQELCARGVKQTVQRYRKRTLRTTSAFEGRKEHKRVYWSFHGGRPLRSLPCRYVARHASWGYSTAVIRASIGTFLSVFFFFRLLFFLKGVTAAVRLSGTPRGFAQDQMDGKPPPPLPRVAPRHLCQCITQDVEILSRLRGSPNGVTSFAA